MSQEQKQDENFPKIDTLWNYQKPEDTAQKFRELLVRVRQAGNKSYEAELLSQLARTQSLQHNFEQALEILGELKEMLTAEMSIPKIRYHLERGRTYNSSNKKAEASEQFLLAFELAKVHNEDYYLVDAAHMLGISEPGESQLKWNLKAMELAEASQNERARKWLGPLYNNIGWTYHDMDNYEKALELFEKSLNWRLEQKDHRGAEIAKWTIARTYRSLGQIERALQSQMDLAAEKQAAGSDPSGYVFEEIAECLLLQEKAEEAKPYFRQAYELLSKDKWLQANEAERLQRLADLSE